jgi:IS5 family transposase
LEDKPAKLRQKDRDARWTVKFTKAKPREDGSMPPVDIAIPLFGYQNRVSIDRGFGFIRRWAATDAAAYEGRRLREGLLDKTNTASAVWADTAYRSAINEAYLARNGFVSRIHRKKPKGRAMPEAIRHANNVKSKIRSRVEHVFAEQKDWMGLFIRTMGSRGQRPRSEWSISSTTSSVYCSYKRQRWHEGIGHQKRASSALANRKSVAETDRERSPRGK